MKVSQQILNQAILIVETALQRWESQTNNTIKHTESPRYAHDLGVSIFENRKAWKEIKQTLQTAGQTNV